MRHPHLWVPPPRICSVCTIVIYGKKAFKSSTLEKHKKKHCQPKDNAFMFSIYAGSQAFTGHTPAQASQSMQSSALIT